MQEVKLTDKGQQQYEVIKAVAEARMNKNRAAVKLGVTRRQINRLLKHYESNGKAAFVHGNRGRKPKHALSDEQKHNIVATYNRKYFDANFSHASELMKKNDGIAISSSALRKLLLAEDVLSPRAHRSTVRNLKKRLNKLQETVSKREQRAIESKLISIENAHCRKPRSAYFGELIQMDASVHSWFGNEKTYLHIAIDDYSGRILAAYFDKEETLDGYYRLLYQILTTEGIPHKFLTDRRTVFDYKRKSAATDKDNVLTQFGFACKTLGIELQCTSVPQAKGRVERQFGTLQSRFVTELRLAGVTTLKAANDILPKLVKDINDHFSLGVDYTKSVFVEQPSPERIDQILAVLSERTVDNGQCIRYENKNFRLLDAKGEQVNLRPGTKGLVAKTLSGALYFTVDDCTYALDEVPVHASHSKEFDSAEKLPKTKEHKYIPPQDHPWRINRFSEYKRNVAAKFYLEV